ncbi:hypothetical protein ASPACDRAFT_39077 [Aspergillus aculeatus ATCC 16872]|uniref:Aminoglycoside phosphotransferase domain-containing protein n=1 Tax=Aspergillus aculeatus (strain ATCC 16872 / CBS 172.66 / WB 5094) TaxID=690307 RepID=A0A1L9X4T4_ASPA1|nr:uncharacterized protein ASPACDRAFT_39077 [Aspergillus aculeatus ATCC 16872]OJK03457.1 hypothetical protein ASPACDRAFT_39077 [Aspergillus aculeatus ATCC 16872]
MSDNTPEEPPDYPLLEEATLLKFEGREFQVFRPYIERRAVFHAIKLDEQQQQQQQVVVKFFIHQHPVLRRSSQVGRLFSGIVQPEFTWEVQALRTARGIDGFPQLLNWESTVQGPEFENPGGRINLIAMTRLPGFPLSFYIYGLHEQSQIKAIKARVVELVEVLRLRGHEYTEGDPGKIIYDPASGKLGICCLRRSVAICSPTEQNDPITEDSLVIKQFGLNLWYKYSDKGRRRDAE